MLDQMAGGLERVGRGIARGVCLGKTGRRTGWKRECVLFRFGVCPFEQTLLRSGVAVHAATVQESRRRGRSGRIPAHGRPTGMMAEGVRMMSDVDSSWVGGVLHFWFEELTHADWF